ncbi:MAG TPA: amidase family protein [Longimicrobiaceae bacterium]|nr:amidase family protein [Longimicrobiaceae bacterium]
MSETTSPSRLPDRRAFMGYFAGIGLGGTLFPGVLWSRVADGAEITEETVRCAAEIAGLEFDAAERRMMVESLKQQERQIEELRRIPLANSVPPAVSFSPVLPGTPPPAGEPRDRVSVPRAPAMRVTANLEELAFLPVTALAELVRRRKVTSLQLTRMYLDRLRRYDPLLRAVVTLTEERAIRQAEERDRELARGRYRGPLHGIPWGAKDLLAVRGYPTTWGAAPFRAQVIDEDATVVKRLDEAGAVLVAKLTLGSLAMGDVWFGGTTRNPWKTDQGSSGSSAGPGSATAAGLVAFSIGSETLGSISSPSTRNGVTGLRPTFGRVPRTGAMALSWTMDKLGPMCRSVDDCALVLAAIHGPDGADPTAQHAVPFRYDARTRPGQLRIGYFKAAFEREERQYPNRRFDLATLETLRRLSANLIPLEVPDLNYGAMRIILTAEAAAAFDELTRSGRDAELTEQGPGSWPNTFRTARFIPAVEYINANRVRTLAMRAWAELFRGVDVIVTPTSGPQLLATNLTGHPAVILPNGFREDGTPVSVTFLGGLFGEGRLLEVAGAYQRTTDFHLKHPVLRV